MKADLTRRTFDPLKHFTRVLLQQGRVQLDADWNEQTAELLHYLRALAADLIGAHGGPDNGSGTTGLAISAFTTKPDPPDFIIGAGHYYVDGILCEADSKLIPVAGFPDADSKKLKVLYWPHGGLAFRKNQYVEILDDDPATGVQVKILDLDPSNSTLTVDPEVSVALQDLSKHPRVRRLITFLTQPDYPIPDAAKKKLSAGTYQVYLDVWERVITYVEDDSIREVALDGPDTAARSKIVWQVKSWKLLAAAKKDCLTVTKLNDLFQWENRGWLKAMASQTSTSTDPCIVSPDARYRGAENQLYRVEIHRPGLAWDGKGDPLTTIAATFKWSRENGSAIYAIVSGGGTATVTLETLGRDDRFGLGEGDWVEIVDDDYVLQDGAGNLLQVHSIDRTQITVTLSGMPDPNVGHDPAKHPLLRRWDHKEKEGESAEGGLRLGSDGAALILEVPGDSNWLELEDGVKIQFQGSDKGQPPNSYRPGDYWLIPARTATGDVEWPREKDSQGKPIAIPPDGVMHHYAPLAVISVGPDGVNVKGPSCQKKFPPMAV